MLARLIKTHSQLILLYSDGTTGPADATSLWRLFTGFRKVERLTGNETRWDTAYPHMEQVPGYTMAFVDEGKQLIIADPSAFQAILAGAAAEEYLTTSEYAEVVGRSVVRVKQMCQAGRIVGAVRKGGQWFIPEFAEYPADARTHAKKK